MFRLGRQLSRYSNMKIVPVPVREDNYAYILIDQPSNQAAFVDPFDVPKVASVANGLGVSVVASITTHHHFDHSGGNKVLVLESSFCNRQLILLRILCVWPSVSPRRAPNTTYRPPDSQASPFTEAAIKSPR